MNKTKKKSIAAIALKIILFFIVALLFVLFFLSKIGGQNDQLREGAEQFLSQATQTRAVIGELRYMGFFPDIRIEISDVIFQQPGDPTNVVMTVESFDFSIPFGQYVLSRKTAEKFSLRGVKAKAGAFTPAPLDIDRVEIIDAAGQEPYLSLEAQYAGKPISGSLSLSRRALKNGKAVYKFPDAAPLQITAAGATLQSILRPARKGFEATDIRLTVGKQALLQGAASFSFARDKTHIKSALTPPSGESVFDADLTVHSENSVDSPKVLYVTGEVASSKRACGDLQNINLLHDTLQFLWQGLALSVRLTDTGLSADHPCGRYFDIEYTSGK